MKFCVKCGNATGDLRTHCPVCGQKLERRLTAAEKAEYERLKKEENGVADPEVLRKRIDSVIVNRYFGGPYNLTK